MVVIQKVHQFPTDSSQPPQHPQVQRSEKSDQTVFSNNLTHCSIWFLSVHAMTSIPLMASWYRILVWSQTTPDQYHS